MSFPDGTSLQLCIEQKYGPNWVDNPEAVRIVEGCFHWEQAWLAGREVPTVAPVYVLTGNCWMCGSADHCGRHCPRNCCWVCGDRDHWSKECPCNFCWVCGERDHWSKQCPFEGGVVVEVGANAYDNLVEALVDFKFKDLHGEELWRAYLGDIFALEQRLGSVDDHPLLRERLRLLHKKAEALEGVIGP